MRQTNSKQESRALQTLLAIDDQQPRYQPHQQTAKPSAKKQLLAPKLGKENQGYRREQFPKVNSSKEELKRILHRLQSTDVLGAKDNVSLKQVRANINNDHSHTCGLKSSRSPKEYQNNCNRSRSRSRKQKNKSILEIGLGDDIRNLMRQKNYSTNALNLKTMHILQQLNAKNIRCFSVSTKETQKGKKGNKNMIAFLRKAA